MEVKEKKSWKEIFEETKEKAKNGLEKTCDWCKEHRQFIYVYGPIIVTSGVEIIKMLSKSDRVRAEKDLKTKFIYDRSKGHYVETKRPLTQREWIQVDSRHDEGESYASILQDMGLLAK